MRFLLNRKASNSDGRAGTRMTIYDWLFSLDRLTASRLERSIDERNEVVVREGVTRIGFGVRMQRY